MIEYLLESFESCIPEISLLCQEHYEEIAERKDVIPLDPDWERYVGMEKAGILFLATVRSDGELIGYYIVSVVPHLHYKSSLTAFTDIFFVQKDFRHGRVGYNLFKFVIKEIKALGVQRFYTSCKLKHDVGPMLDRLGFKEIERNYAMVFDNE